MGRVPGGAMHLPCKCIPPVECWKARRVILRGDENTPRGRKPTQNRKNAPRGGKRAPLPNVQPYTVTAGDAINRSSSAGPSVSATLAPHHPPPQRSPFTPATWNLRGLRLMEGQARMVAVLANYPS